MKILCFCSILLVVEILSYLPTSSGSILRAKLSDHVKPRRDEMSQSSFSINRENLLPNREGIFPEDRRTLRHFILRFLRKEELSARGVRGKRQSEFHIFQRQIAYKTAIKEQTLLIKKYGMVRSQREELYDNCLVEGFRLKVKPFPKMIKNCEKLLSIRHA